MSQTSAQQQTPTSPPQKYVPLLDYITNIMKFVEAILSNNSTDDHCKEFVKQKGLVPLIEILSLPNLPIDFPTSTACQSVAQVCKAILHLAREQQVIDETLNSLSRALDNSERLFKRYTESYLQNRSNSKRTTSTVNGQIDGSVLLAELAATENPLEACNQPLQTPLLHSISHVHSLIYLLTTLGKVNQNDVRQMTISKWGSPDLGVKCLRDLSKLYMSLIWESSMLLWLLNEDQQEQQLAQLMQIQHLHQHQLNQLMTQAGRQRTSSSVQQQQSDMMAQAVIDRINQLIQQLSACSTTSGDGHFEFNRSDLEKIKSCLQPPATVSSAPVVVPPTATVSSETMITDQSSSQPSGMDTVGSNNQVEKMETGESVTQAPAIVYQPLHVSYNKLLRPLFNSSSKLARSLCEIFGLLVKLAAGSWKNSNNRRQIIPHLNHQSQTTPTQASINVATNIVNTGVFGFASSPSDDQQDRIVKNGFEFFDIARLPPKFRLTFYIWSISFTSSVLFDEQKRPYHLMLQRFEQLGGLKALFDAFHWSLSLIKISTPTPTDLSSINFEQEKLNEGVLQFIEAWLQLIQKLVNTKNMLETRHSLNNQNLAAHLVAAAAANSTQFQQQQQAQLPLIGTENSGTTGQAPATSSLATGGVLSAAEIKRVCQFDPVKFLFKVHREAFEALMCLWSDDSKSSIIRENYALSETVLNILCQILVGDSQLQKKIAEQKSSASSNNTAAATSNQGSTGGPGLVRAFLLGDQIANAANNWRLAASASSTSNAAPITQPM